MAPNDLFPPNFERSIPPFPLIPNDILNSLLNKSINKSSLNLQDLMCANVVMECLA